MLTSQPHRNLDRVARGRRFQVKPCSDAEAPQRLGLGTAGRSTWS